MKTAKTERSEFDPTPVDMDLPDAYLALQERYDALEERILGRQRHKAEAQILELETVNAKLADAKEVVEKLRTRLAEFKDRRERHLEERLRNRATIESLREDLTRERRKNAQAKPAQDARSGGSGTDRKTAGSKARGNGGKTSGRHATATASEKQGRAKP